MLGKDELAVNTYCSIPFNIGETIKVLMVLLMVSMVVENK
jgi:hypothetical protein